jgi:hypothetical protein
MARPRLPECGWRQSNSLREEREVAQDRSDKELTNEINDETGQYDARFMLWRRFCTENNVPVETLPSQLNAEQRARWEKMKAGNLK